MKVIFLNRFFYPDESATSQMLSDLAFTLARRQQLISVVTSRQRYDESRGELPSIEIIEGVSIVRVWTSRFGRHNLLGRLIDYLTFYFSAAWQLYCQARVGDIIVAKTDPPALSIVALPMCMLRRARLVNWLQDVFPETGQVLGYAPGIMRLPCGLLRWLRDRSLNAADMNVVVGERMAEYISKLRVCHDRLRVIPNWADGHLIRPIDHAVNPLRITWNLDRAFVVEYSGNLGRAHEIKTIIEGMRVLVAREKKFHHPIEWLFIGGGALYRSLRDEVARLRLTSVHFKPYQPRALLSWSLSVADVHIISLRPELEGLVVPSKFYGIAAAGRPVIFIGDDSGEIAQLIKRHQCGYTVAMGDETMLADRIADLAANPGRCREMGERARQAFLIEFDMPMAMERWENLLCEISGSKRSTAHNGAALEQAPLSHA
jgi:glycosyltransferase involved in cell wall biosynthesis